MTELTSNTKRAILQMMKRTKNDVDMVAKVTGVPKSRIKRLWLEEQNRQTAQKFYKQLKREGEGN